MRQLAFEAIGTHWLVDLPALSDLEFSEIEIKIKERIEIFDKNYSRFRPDSLVMQMARKPGDFILPDDAKIMLDLYQELYQVTDGKFTPMIGQVLSDLGYDESYSFKERKVERPHSWDDVIEYNYPQIKIKKPVILDFGGIGKGYLIDKIDQLLKKEGIMDFTIDAGGDMLYSTQGNEKLRVGLEDPEDFSKAIGIATIHKQAICGSAGNRRKWGSYHHIINPKTLQSPMEILGAWVVADNCMIADAMTTCLFLVDPDVLSQYDFEYLIMFKNRSVVKSTNFPAEIFI